ncbi:baculoviral IAP repeat-containing protein 6-like isoform X2 [Lytechinus variegatus]|uniref:baculoviral IAP repeat-containing protein 6-like isoform X2 n=1 Tax=Lytechinus variegatus TaxID=7654 RepID=UPI001BB29B73|nr:baculoviral IAP repeat-containing protein 6-like isoform X2 [Lytechinus variegatus]
MAAAVGWSVEEDGSLSVGEQTVGIAYHPRLNTVLAVTAEPSIKVLDVNSGVILKKSSLSAPASRHVECRYLSGSDQVFLTDGYSVGLRKDLGGVLLLDSALQTSVTDTNNDVMVEIPYSEASQLLACLRKNKIANSETVMESIEEELERYKLPNDHAYHKTTKWATVHLRLPHATLKKVINALVVELSRTHQRVSALPICTAILDRLQRLYPDGQEPLVVGGDNTIEKSQMYSEATRRQTFAQWPHMDYKWALPEPMAQAGFYHQPSSIGDDRAMCFTCSVCLVCWEPTDEPWSEHERHSPTCPFVRGEPTHNVPFSVTLSTGPAHSHSKTEKISCVSEGNTSSLMATSTESGRVCIWEVHEQLKLATRFIVNPKDPIFKGQAPVIMDTEPVKAVKQAWMTPEVPVSGTSSSSSSTISTSSSTSSGSTGHVPMKDELAPVNSPKGVPETSSKTDELKPDPSVEESEREKGAFGSLEVIEVSGAWKSSDNEKPECNGPLTANEGIPMHNAVPAVGDEEPSDSVAVSALGMLNASKLPSIATIGTPDMSFPCLVAGVSIRKEDQEQTSNSKEEVRSNSVIETDNFIDLDGPGGDENGDDAGTGGAPPKKLKFADAYLGDSVDGDVDEKIGNKVAYVNYLVVYCMMYKGKSLPVVKKPGEKASSSSGFHKTQSMYFSLSQETQKLDLDDDELGYSDLEDPLNFQFSPMVNNNPPPVASGSGSVVSKQVSMSVKAVQCVELPEAVQTNDYVVTSVRTSLDEQYLMVVLSPHSGKMFEREAIDGGVDKQEKVDPVSISTESTTESVQNDLNKESSSFMMMSNEDCGISVDEVDTGPCSSGTDDADSRTNHQHFVKDGPPKASSGGFLVIYKLKRAGQMISIEKEPCHIHRIASPEDSLSYLTPLPSGVTDASSDEDEVDQYMNSSTDNMDKDETDSPSSPSIGKWTALTQDGHLIVFDAASFSVLLSILPSHFDFTLTSSGAEDKTNSYIALTYCTGMERLCVCTGGGKISFLQLDDGESSIKVNSGADQKDSGKTAILDSRLTANIDKSSKEFIINSNLTISALHTLHQLTKFEILVPRFSATVPPSWTEIQQEQQQRRHPQHLHQRQQGDALQHTRTWKLQPDGSTSQEHLFEIVLPRICAVGHIDIKFSLLPFCTVPPGIQVTLLQQSEKYRAGEKEKMNIKSTPIDAHINFNMNAGSSARSKEPKEQNLDVPGLPPPFLGALGTDDAGIDEAGPSNRQPPPSQDGQSTQSSGQRSALTESSFLRRHREDVLCGPCGLELFVDTPSHTGTVMLTSKDLMLWRGRSFLLHIWTSDEGSAEGATNGRSKAASSDQASSFVPQFHTNVDLADRLTTVQLRKDMEKYTGCDWIQELSITVCKSKKVNLPKERFQRALMVESSNFHQDLLNTVIASSSLSSSLTEHKQKQILAFDVLCWVAGVHITEPERPSDLVEAIQYILPDIIKICYLEADRSLAHKCSRFLALCLGCAKRNPNPDVTASFQKALLDSLLHWLPTIALAPSSGSLHWFFVILGLVKQADYEAVSGGCMAMLKAAARQLDEATLPQHVVLRAKFGYYGTPLEPNLFDVEPPRPPSKLDSTGPSTTSTGTTTSSSVPLPQIWTEVGPYGSHQGLPVVLGGGGAFDIGAEPGTKGMSLRGKGSLGGIVGVETGDGSLTSGGYFMKGLLEVEPLHFACCGMSDGAHIERIGGGIHPASSVHPVPQGQGGKGNTAQPGNPPTPAYLATLTNAMATAEKQLQKLKEKTKALVQLKKYNYIPGSSKGVGEPSPKNSPLFMTPPVSPPSEPVGQAPTEQPPLLYSIPDDECGLHGQPGEGSQGGKSSSKSSSKDDLKFELDDGVPSSASLVRNLLHPPSSHMLVIERMHSGARRYAVLDFGRPIVLTDVYIPACSDLTSLSVDIWTQLEEVDGQRLAVAMDIESRDLVLNDLLPPPVCRYLKITVVGNYGSNSPKSKVPLGTFYGHSFIHQEMKPRDLSDPALVELQKEQYVGLAMAILDDIQCRYSLATSRLQKLLQAYESYHQTENQMDGSYTQTREKVDTNGSIRKAYVECVQLQQQLNVVQRTILRLRQKQHQQPYTMTPITSPALAVKNTSTDALRIMCEHLLEVLLSTTQGAMALPVSLCCALDAESCKSIFRHLCVMGTPRLSLLTGTLLVRVCGSRQWWGEFLAAALKEFFQSDQPTMFPQDRVFLLLTSLGQTSLASSNASSVLEDLLRLLTELLSPLLGNQFVSSYGSPEGSLDLPLVGWVLLFLSRVLDHSSGSHGTGQSDNTQDTEGGATAAGASGGATAMPDNHHTDKGGAGQGGAGGGSNRWDFLTSQLQAPGNNPQRSHSSGRDVVRGVKKQVQSHKDLLYDIKGGKKSSQAKYGEDSKGDPISDFHLKKKLYHQVAKKYHLGVKLPVSSYEVRNVLRARMAARSARGQKTVQGGSSRGTADGGSSSAGDLVSTILLTRDKCIPVVQGLVRLLLAMDFTCHVDLFLVTCKVLARIANATRPAITLAEIMSQDELIQLVSRFCSSEYCAGNSAWGGPWPSHAITCLLLDILEGERLYPYVEEPAGASGGTTFTPPMGATGTDPDLIADSLTSGGAEASAPTESETEVNNASGGEYDSGGNGGEAEENEGLEEPLIIDELSGDPEIVGEGGNDPLVDMDLLFGSWKTSGGLFGDNAPKKLAQKSGAGSMVDPVKIPTSALLAYAKKNRKDKLKILVRGDGRESSGSAFTPRMSSAVDARLDQDLEMSAEWFLKMSSLMEAETVSQTFTSLPPPPAFAPEEKPDVELLDMGQTDDDLAASRAMSGSSSNIHPSVRSSRDLISTCFHHLFAGLESDRIRLHSLLQLWLTINEGSISDTDGNTSHFNDSRVPNFPLDKPSISHLLATLRKERNLSVWTWCLAFRVLTVQINTRGSTKDAVSVANSMVNDPNMFHALFKFLSGGSFQGRRSGHQDFQVGPTVTLAFHQLLLRLHLRVFSGPSAGAKALKNLLLRVVRTLVQPREAISEGVGPLDAQITFLELILEQTFSSTDLGSIATMVDNITLLIYEHVIDGSGVTQLSSENGGSSRANLANALAGKLKAGASRVLHNENSREALMCGLLQLVNELLKMSVSPDPFGTSVWSPVGGRGSLHSGGVAYPTPPTSMSDDDKERTGDVSGLSAAASSAFASWSAAPQSQPSTPLRLADLVLTNKETVSNLLFALGHSSSMAMAAMLNPGFFSQGSEPLMSTEPLSIGDHIFQILATLNKEASHVRIVLQAILSYLSCANGRRGEMLSEPLLWYTLSVLNSPTAMDSMHEIGGIEIICANLVNSSRASIDPNPSIISPIMQLTCPPKPPSSSNTSSSSSNTNTGFTKRGSTTVDEENVEGLTNFAPYGVISCSNMTTRPAESLLLPTLSNRRSRQSWAHTFSSEETWCDLTITLPSAVVLEEIHILPHVTNLATCPSAVSVEISPSGSSTIPVCPPLATSGLTSIKLKMPRPMVTSSVCLQLRRPRESTLMALTRIRLLGTTVLGGGHTGGSGGITFSHMNGVPMVPPTAPHNVAEDEAVRGSTRWLRLLHHCLAGTFLSSTVSSIAQTAAQTPGLLTTCMALLASPHCRPNRRDIESLLLQLSRSRTEVGLTLVDMFLRNNYCFGHGEHDSGLGLLGRPSSLASDSSVDIIYQLGTGSDPGTRERVQTLLDWLGDTARVALHMHSSYHRAPRTFSPIESGLLHPAPIHVHCVAAVLWATHSQNNVQHMVNMIPTELFSSIYEWSTVLPVNSALKRAADFVLCSMCMIQPAHFDSLLQWMGVMVGGPVELQAPITDDSKEDELNILLTDDSKGANLQHQSQPNLHLPTSQPITRQEFSHVIIDEAHLSLLALACQSDVATKRLLDSQFLVLLAEALSEFCTQELIRTESLNGFNDPLTDASKLKASGSRVQSPRSPRNSARRESTESLPSDATVVLTADLVAPVLNFFKDLSAQIEIKNWLASPEGVVFWAPLLALLCTSNTVTLLSSMPNLNGVPRRSHLLSASQRASLENASIAFFSRCTLCHPGNQKLLAQVICDVICTQDLQTGSPFVISGFMRRLILQLMLEDESVSVAVSSVCQLVKGPQSWTGRIIHPSLGLGHKNMLVETKLTTTCTQLITYLTDTLGLKNLPGDKKTKPSTDSSKTDKQSFVMVNLSPDKLDVTETEINGNIGNSIVPPSTTASTAGSSTSGGATGGAASGATVSTTAGASAGASPSAASSSASTSASSSTKQPEKFLLYPGATNFPASMVPTLPPELLPKSMDRWAPFFNTFSNPAASMAGAGATSFNMPGLVLSHERLGSQNFPGHMTIGQAITVLQRRGLPDGYPTLEMNIRMSTSLLGASKTDSSKTQEAQEGRNESGTSTSSNEADQHIPEDVLLDTPPISSFLEVFAHLGGLALIAEHLPQLYQDSPLAQQQQQVKQGAQTSAGGSSVDKMTASGGGASAAMHSSWWKYSSDLGMKDLGEFDDYEVLMEGPHSTTISSVGGGSTLASTLTTTSNVPSYPSYGIGSTAAQLQATSFSNIVPLHTIPMTTTSSSSSSSSCPPQGSTTGQSVGSCTAAIPPHSLAAFGLFLRLPGYAEVLLKEQKKAQFLLRLMLGVTDDGDGGQILSSPLATSLPTLPFTVLVTLFDSTPLTTDDGVLLRRMTLEIGAVHLVLACLSVLSHHGPRGSSQPATGEGGPAPPNGSQVGGVNDKNQNFWAKGTGFGTGSTTSGWNVEEALVRQKAEEEHVTCLLKVLSSYINPVNSTTSSSGSIDEMSGDLNHDQLTTIFPSVFIELLTQSCLIPAISSYLRNDSVLDMSRHVPLYCAVLEILRALALCPLLVHLLLPQGDNGDKSVIKLLENMKGCVDTYTSKLKLVKPSKKSSSRHSSTKESSTISKEEEAEAEGLTQLVPEIQRTVEMVKKLTSKILAQRQGELNDLEGAGASASGLSNSNGSKNQSADQRYIAVMTDLQFDTFQMVTEDSKGKIQFAVPHHYASNAKSVGNVTNAARARRLAQEAVTLSTSLPLSASSSVFVRCDEDRLDVMKVLITGPSETPYSNGCFEFDIYFPADYPNSPMLVNLETTGQHSVRFNPNLYNDGKVCLSVLNTWHGRPEEKWNSQTSSFLQVLVSIQSLILVSEPYFNEPGYERSRGTQAGTWSSREYDANIMQATVEWGMLDMVRNPPPVFKDVVQAHFYLKRAEVMAQCEEWIALVGQYCNDKRVGRSMLHHWKNLKKHTAKLREELNKLQPPEFLKEQLESESEPLPPLSSDATNDVSCASVSEDADKSSENDAEHSGSSSSSQEITTAETSTADSQITEPTYMFGMSLEEAVVYDPVLFE